jgi:hypothetical protein
MRWALFTAAAALAIATAAAAQPVPEDPQAADPTLPEQPTGTPAEAAEAPAQVSTNIDSLPVEAQLTAPLKSAQQPAQLSTGRPTAQAPVQLSSGPPTAQGPESLSTRAEGRPSGVERLKGSDRCDAAIPKDKQSDACKKVIESRAEEYARAQAPEPSPEQRLLLDQQMNGAGEAITDATRRLAKSGEPDGSTAEMGIASIVLDQSAPAPAPPKPAEDPTTQAAVNAIVQMVTQVPH